MYSFSPLLLLVAIILMKLQFLLLNFLLSMQTNRRISARDGANCPPHELRSSKADQLVDERSRFPSHSSLPNEIPRYVEET